MSEWYRYHLDETITAMAVPDNHRFWVLLRDRPGSNRFPVEFCRWTLRDAQKAADRLVQAYYPHECGPGTCGRWKKSENS